MRPEPRLPHRAQGFALVAAIFVMVIIALVVTAMARLSTTQHGTVSLSIQQARAYQSARAGLEWGISRGVNGDCQIGPVALSLLGSPLAEFTDVQVECVSMRYDEDDVEVTIYQLTATAENGKSGSRPDYAYRQLTATIER
jgi:MSHA biogenesis protein MshP